MKRHLSDVDTYYQLRVLYDLAWRRLQRAAKEDIIGTSLIWSECQENGFLSHIVARMWVGRGTDMDSKREYLSVRLRARMGMAQRWLKRILPNPITELVCEYLSIEINKCVPYTEGVQRLVRGAPIFSDADYPEAEDVFECRYSYVR
jgi:hypothetical protein